MTAPARPDPPGGLWSLWDIVNKLRVDDLLTAMAFFSPIWRKWEAERAGRQPFAPHQHAASVDAARKLREALAQAEMPISLEHADGFVAALMRAAPEGGKLVLSGEGLDYATHHLNRLLGALQDEAKQRLFLSISGGSARYVAFRVDDQTATAFPDAIFDLEEAAKCMSVERWTATVFHLMRAMEVVVCVLAKKLCATVSNEHGETLPWGILTANMKPAIDAMPKGPAQDEWYKRHALLHSVNRAYRTKTAHPAAKYTQEEAEYAFVATQALIRELANA